MDRFPALPAILPRGAGPNPLRLGTQGAQHLNFNGLPAIARHIANLEFVSWHASKGGAGFQRGDLQCLVTLKSTCFKFRLLSLSFLIAALVHF